MRTRGSVVGKVLTYFFLALLALIFLVPVFYVMYNSLLPKRYIGSFVPPSVWSLDNYKELFADFPIMGGIRIRPFPPWRWCWATLSSRPWRATAWPGSGSRAKR